MTSIRTVSSFVDLQGYSQTQKPRPAEDFLTHVLQSMKPAERAPENPILLQRLYTRVLTGRRFLLVADNLAPQAGLERLLPPPGSLLLF